MDGKFMVVLLALTLSGAGFAGCIEAPAFLQSQTGEQTALQARQAADAAALEWNPEAKLASVMTIELTDSSEPRVPADPEVGNGRALAWWYVYCAGAKESRQIQAFRVFDGVATPENETAAFAAQAPLHMMEELTGWAIDSDAAIAAAKTDDRFRLAAQGYNATVVQGVARHADVSAWWIVAGSVDGIVVASVDATDGTLLEVQELDMGFTMPRIDFASTGPERFVPEPIHLEGEGELEGEAVKFPLSIVFPMEGEMDFAAEGGDPTRGASWAIVDEDGEWVAGPRGEWFRDGGATKVSLEEPGEYTLVIRERGFMPFSLPSQPLSYEFTLHLDPVLDHAEHDDRR